MSLSAVSSVQIKFKEILLIKALLDQNFFGLDPRVYHVCCFFCWLSLFFWLILFTIKFEHLVHISILFKCITLLQVVCLVLQDDLVSAKPNACTGTLSVQQCNVANVPLCYVAMDKMDKTQEQNHSVCLYFEFYTVNGIVTNKGCFLTLH